MTDDTVDHRAVPGTFERQDDGSFVRTDEATKGGSAPAPTLDIEDARELAQANQAAGFPVPPQVQAVIDQADAAEAKKTATAAARAAAKEGGKTAGQPAATQPDASGKDAKE